MDGSGSRKDRLSFFPDEAIDGNGLWEKVAKDTGIEQPGIVAPGSDRGLVDSRFSPAFSGLTALEEIDESTIDIAVNTGPALMEPRQVFETTRAVAATIRGGEMQRRDRRLLQRDAGGTPGRDAGGNRE